MTWVGFVARASEAVPAHFAEVFAVVRAARDAGVACAQAAVAAGRAIRGFEVDRATRAVIAAAGLGEYFVHRTGHSLGLEVHASGANMDDFETHDDRLILPHTAFTIEPGVYAPAGQPFGIRSEVNLFVHEDSAEVTSPSQAEIVRI